MPDTYEELKGKTIAELREIAKEQTDEAVQGYTQMNKDHLLPALCKALKAIRREYHRLNHRLRVNARLPDAP